MTIEYTPLSDATLMGQVAGIRPGDDLDEALEAITGSLAGYDHAEEYDSINLWEQNMLSREGRTLRQADIEFDPNFCLGGETQVITRQGVRRLGEMAGENVELWTAEGWRKGEIASFGQQRLRKLSFVAASWIEGGPDSLGRVNPPKWKRCSTEFRVEVRATAEHLWELVDGSETRDLKPGDIVRGEVIGAPEDTARFDAGWIHGMVFADGSRCNAKRTPRSRSYEIRLCGAKAAHLWRFEQSPLLVSVRRPAHSAPDPMVYLNTGVPLKKMPGPDYDADYMRGFVEGWLAGDGSGSATPGAVRLATQDEGALAWLQAHAAQAGWYLTGYARSRAAEVTFPGGVRYTPQHDMFSFSLTRSVRAWKLVEAVDDGLEQVYCATVPGVHRFTLASGLYTGNCSVVIDAVNDRLEINSVTATSGTDTDTAASDGATRLLAQVWEDNELDNLYHEWHRNALRDGDAYLVVWPSQFADVVDMQSERGDDIDAQDAAVSAGVNITYVDPRMGRMFYDPENPRVKRFFAQMWRVTLAGEKKPRVRMNLFYPDRIEKWISGPGDQQKTAKEFLPYLDPDEDGDNDYPGSGSDPDSDAAPAAAWPMVNPYGQIPVFHLRTGHDYGLPEHRNAFGPQDAVSKLSEMLMVTVEFNGFPQRYAIQEADSFGTQSIREDPLAADSPQTWDHDFTETALSTTSVVAGAISNETGANYESNPGGMMLLKGFKEVSQFQVANPGAFLDPIREYILFISCTTSTPLWKFQGMGGTTPSGEMLKIAEMPLVKKVRDRMRMFGTTWRQALEFALLILGVTGGVKVGWADPTTGDLMETWLLVEKKVALGVPRDVALMQAGVSESEAAEWSKTYDDVFALAAMQQARALRERAEAELMRQQATAAKIANGIPQRQAFIEDGYSGSDVDAWLADREEEMGLGRKIALLQQLGQAIQSIGTGVSLGILDAPAANEIVARVMNELVPAVPLDVLDLAEETPDAVLPEPAMPPGVMFAGEPPMPPGQSAELVVGG